MVIEAIFGALNGFFAWVVGLFGGIQLPQWSDQLAGNLDDLATQISGMGVWVNFPLGVTVAGVVISVFLACLLVKVVLRIVAFLPFAGGAG